MVGDVTNIDSCQEMAETAVSTYGKLNVLVNNVGISGPGSVTDVEELLSNLVEIPFQANCRSVRRSRHPVDLAML